MSKENLEQFMSKVADSEELQAKIGEEIDAESLIALGAEHGCEFTAEELQEAAELSDEELDTVAGGFSLEERMFVVTYGTLRTTGAGQWKHDVIRARRARCLLCGRRHPPASVPGQNCG